MNLHALVSGAIAVVNPFVVGTVRHSTGSTAGADYSRTPLYTDVPNVSMQVQALTQEDVRQLDGLNIQGVTRTAYFTGTALAAVRNDLKGGDLIVFAPGVIPEGTTWLVANVPEAWLEPGWVKVLITLQNED